MQLLPHDVVRLVIAARDAAFGDHIQDENVRRELDAASEAFASRVPWDDEPAENADGLCSDCPPANYPTDKTRCDPCPRRQ